MTSKIVVNNIEPDAGISTVTVNGDCQATTFKGDGSNLTGLVSLANGADNRVITASSASALTGESNLTFSSNQLTVHEAKLKGNQLLFTTSGTAYLDHSTVGQDIQVRVSTSSSQDTTGPTFKSNGNLAFAAGKGIDFSAQTASSLSGVSVSSELLDHYEEGTFTPTFGASNGSSTAGYSVQTGKYTRIGNIVHVQIYIALSSLSTNSHSHAWISGLPVAPVERTATSSIMCGGMQNSGYTSFPIAGRTGANATRIELFQATNGGVTDFSTSSVSGTAYFILQCTYRAA